MAKKIQLWMLLDEETYQEFENIRATPFEVGRKKSSLGAKLLKMGIEAYKTQTIPPQIIQ